MKMIRSNFGTVSLMTLALVALLGGGVARAETATNTINGVTNNPGGTYYVDNTGPFNGLIVTNAGVLIDNTGIIGNTAGSSNNAVLVTGAGSVWNNSGDLNVGYAGAGNQLTIANSGTVFNGTGYIGWDTGASNNAALVTGAGSVWNNNGDLNVGYSGAGNQLTISNGGAVYNTDGVLGYNGSASNNTAVVDGSGSAWHMSGDLIVGAYGGNNTLIVRNNASVSANELDVGALSAGNTLIITNGGKVSSTSGYMGNDGSETSNNVIVVDGTGSAWNITGILHVGDLSANNTLTIRNGGAVYNTTGVIGNGSSASNNAVLVTGTGSVWSNSSDLYVGQNGAGNKLTITNSGAVYAQSVTLGVNTSSSNNVLAISGGSLITTNIGFGTLDVRRGAVTMDSGSILANMVLLTNGLNGTLNMSGGTLTVNTLTNDGSANLLLSGGTLKPLSANAYWSAALVVSNTVTLNTVDTGGLLRTNVLSGNLSGGGTLNVTGTGKLSMNGTDTGGGLITMQSGATLGGTGSLANVQILSNATLAAGNSIGAFTATNLTLAGGAHIQEEINATNGVKGVDWDLITVNGPAALSGISSITPLIVDVVNYGGLNGAVGPTNTISWDFLDASGGISGYASNAFAVTTTGLDGWTNGIWSVAEAGNSLQLSFTAVPEPTSVALVFLLGGVLVGWRRLRRWRA
jgi:T5SS/PEP-CTERM-associated repeat protein